MILQNCNRWLRFCFCLGFGRVIKLKINKSMLTAVIIAAAVVISVFGTAAASGADDSLNVVDSEEYFQQDTEIKLSHDELRLGMGESYSLSASVSAAEEISWISDNTAVVQAGDNGKISAVGLGETTVSAQSANGAVDSCKISVLSEPNSMSLNKTSLTLGIGETYDLNSKLPSGTAAHSIVYTSSNSSVAAVKAGGGLVTAKKSGTAVITATAYNGVKVSCTVKVSSSGFTSRTTAPDISNLNYRPTNMGGYNPFTGSLSMFPSVHGRGSGRGNCTAYAWGRVCEVYGKSVADKLPRGNAGSWYYSYSGSKGSTPKAGAVAVWSGHVAFVEKVNGSSITISESGYTSCVFRTQTGTPYSLGYYGSFIGYIYP